MIKPNSCVRVLLRDRDEAVVAGVGVCRDSLVRHGFPEPAATVGGAEMQTRHLNYPPGPPPAVPTRTRYAASTTRSALGT